jgi:hypothetical protein
MIGLPSRADSFSSTAQQAGDEPVAGFVVGYDFAPVPGPRLRNITPSSGRAGGISAVVATKSVANKQTITNLGNMAPLLCRIYFAEPSGN